MKGLWVGTVALSLIAGVLAAAPAGERGRCSGSGRRAGLRR
jgi:hypothetical protein